MITDPIIISTEKFVKEVLKNAEGGHDWWHIYRVWNNVKLILKTEKADPLICQLAALVHDIGDHKFTDDTDKGRRMVEEFFNEKSLEKDKIKAIIDIMDQISFSKSHKTEYVKSPELLVVQDADRLDAIGAIGIARAFNYGGFKNRKIYDPTIKPVRYNSALEYIKSDAPTINHFYEKLLLLKDMMNTDTGKRIAKDRHEFMLKYLERFFSEWNGDN